MSMASATDLDGYGRSAAIAPARPVAGLRVRDPRLDFYRGIAMFIILCAHTPGNYFTLWIPARWGFSDATEIFVFCSGMASAIAFGGTFVRRGWWLGTARVAHRVGQIYWAHLGMFFVIAAMLAAIDQIGGFDKHYIGSLNLWKFFADPAVPLVGLFTLTWVPNYFDILPMYMMILAMMPLVVALAQVHVALAGAACIAVWLAAQGALVKALGIAEVGINFPAEPWSDREWFFNPFGWQLVFFTGFALMRGWIPAPPVRLWLILLCAVIVVANVLVSDVAVREWKLEWARDWRKANGALFFKSDFGILRYVQFLSLAYLAWVVAGPQGAHLRPEPDGAISRTWAGIVTLITKVGQQSLAVFLFSMVLARFSGFVMDRFERDAWNIALANFIGFALLICVAYTVAWFKAQPWKTSATG